MSEDTDPDRFYKRSEGFFYALSRKRNLGIGLGRWDHPKHGNVRVIAVYGWIGQLFVTLTVFGPPSWWARGQVNLCWYVSDKSEPFEFKHIGTRLRAPVSRTTTAGFLAMAKKAIEDLRWLEAQPSADAVFADQLERNVAPISRMAEAAADPDNEPSGDDPEEVT